VAHRVGFLQRLDAPGDGATGRRVGLVVAGHQHRGVGYRPEFERELSRRADVEIVVANDRQDPVRPRARRGFVVGGHREVDAVTAVTADAVAPFGVDRADGVVGVGVVAAPPPVTPEWRVDLDEYRPARLGEEIGVECHAQCGRQHPVPVGDVAVVGDGALALEERAVEASQGVEKIPPRGGGLMQ
jgi:hypothetical protein